MMSSSDHKVQMSSEKSNQDDLELRDREEKLDDPLQPGLPPPSTASTSLPSASSPGEQVKKIHPGIVIAIWITLSSSVILYNKGILSKDNLNFPYPIFLTTWHLTFATIGTRILHRSTRLLDGLNNVQMSWDRWMKSIVPIGALFSASLIFSNMAYLTLSVSFIQMLKAFTSVAVLGMSVLMGLESPTKRTLVLVVFISSGVALASYGEIDFLAKGALFLAGWAVSLTVGLYVSALSGFICQALGICFEAARLVAIQKLLHGMKMDPLVSLYYFAPVCAALNATLVPFYEGSAPFYLAWERLGPFVLLTNASCAFLLNIAVVFLIGCASSLVLTLSGVLKDVLLVGLSVFLFGSPVTLLQMIGYAAALFGLFVFKMKPEQFDAYVQQIKSYIR